MTTKDIGNLGEILAVKVLLNKNFKIINKNFRSKRGEIDIICSKDNVISFVEVKSICMFKNNFILEPREQINNRKIFKIRNTANYFLTINNLNNIFYKFDLMEIKFWGNKKYSYNYIENIF
ncbi:hypothetical protein SFBM_0676 [Candidatus Arthromitus sp. SFB-mouse-Japan]|uniref:YraN family protein n=1 Tax=unclassified Candidatus Neoarthromitus TaxID=2638829 RepID=UPI00021B8095|nr:MULTISPECIES: YraN family protein [unclassified Candidatus Arthromitus]EIA23463.1 hypothetical protein SFB1_161G1 [Candidatus Arthromitus sp. SFB-1]EIA26075.1 hypothetical protein SFB3_049G14 [Candidatus Arthromitus sp. SFB-3]EIA26387.1 hypothetical protein SFB4_259G20 [Candidatus Arthromitus sp. SFB-4]EIA26740.1 Putative endonuclease [Candidatus Arthromitus sp. SFB-5]EIA28608.1 hypothetical protein SFB6_038G20 [Candidatus Arthromitus sp. SFB-co]EIA30727.1 hypothetical protein SFBSU_006G40